MSLPQETDKPLLRKQVAGRFKVYDRQMLADWSERITEKIEQSEWFAQARKIACFYSLDDEVGTHKLIKNWASRKEVFLPVILDDNQMELRRFVPNSELRFNRFNIPEPTQGGCCEIEDIDLFLVPGVAFDRSFYRLGRGKGYYDRLLATTTAKKVGLCFDFQLFDTIPHAPHDIKMDAVVTPEEVVR